MYRSLYRRRFINQLIYKLVLSYRKVCSIYFFFFLYIHMESWHQNYSQVKAYHPFTYFLWRFLLVGINYFRCRPTILVQHDCELWGDVAKVFRLQRFSEWVLKATNGRVKFFRFWGDLKYASNKTFPCWKQRFFCHWFYNVSSLNECKYFFLNYKYKNE